MELISQEVSALGTSVTVVNAEKGTSRPVLGIFKLRLDDVQNNRNPIFVVIPDNSLMCISCI
jgi:hypothetical protein